MTHASHNSYRAVYGLHALTGTRTQPLSDSSGIIGGFLATWKSLVARWIQMTNGICVAVDQEGFLQSVTINLMQIKVEHCGVYAKICDTLSLMGKAD